MTKEIQERLDALFEILKTPRKDSTIDIFKTAVSEMMDFVYQRDPSMVQTWLDDLGAVEWQNYLTPSEAEKIVSEMMPEAPWSRDVWSKAMDNLGLEKEDKPYYNSCALWVTMNAVYSDHAKSLAKIIGSPLGDIPSETLVNDTYLLAVDKLKDEDAKVNIRHHYGL